MTDISDPARCPACGEPTPGGARFCASCGASLSQGPPPPVNVGSGRGEPAPDKTNLGLGASAPMLRPPGPLARLHAAIPVSRRVATATLAVVVVVAAAATGALIATRGTSTSPRSLKTAATSPTGTSPPAPTATSTSPTAVATFPPTTSATSAEALPRVYSEGCPGDYPATLEPTDIPLACADYNLRLTELTWSSWTAATAHGSGTLMQNDCTPNCAGGTFHSYPTTVTLSDPVTSRTQGLIFATVTWISPTGSTQSEPIGPGVCSNDPNAHDC